jgi:hypothetical protein
LLSSRITFSVSLLGVFCDSFLLPSVELMKVGERDCIVSTVISRGRDCC